MIKPTSKAQKKREQQMLDELRSKHSYLMYEIRHKAERETMLFSHDRKTGKSNLRPGVAIKLVVPVDSALGNEIVEMRKRKAKEAKKGKKR